MGSAMARNLAAAGLITTVWDRSAAATAPLSEAIEGGPLDAPIADAKLHKMQTAITRPSSRPSELKDVDLAIAAADGGDLPRLSALSRQWRAAVDAGYGREDVSAAQLALGGGAHHGRSG